MDLENKMSQLIKLSQRIKAQEPPAVTLHQQQAAITIPEIEKCIYDLISDKAPITIISASLFYFWFTLEAPLRNLSERQIQQSLQSLNQTMQKIVGVITSVVNSFPDHEPTNDMKKLGENLDVLKAYFSDAMFNRPLSHEDVVRHTAKINTRIHTDTSNLLRQSFHPEIIGNVLFSNWMRLSTFKDDVSEEYYQKIEFYFVEIIKEVRKQVPILFQHLR